jgi:hypothetical protein
MKLNKALLAVAVVGASAMVNANAQSVQMVGIGSSALFLELGQAAAKETAIGASCTFTKGSGTVFATDVRTGVGSLTENGQFWIAWTPTGTSCSTTSSATKIYAYLQTDSTVGNRCVLASPACKITVPTSLTTPQTPGNLLAPVQDQSSIPSAVQSALNQASFNTAGTDIRPEDAKFATVRALTPCGATIGGSNSQYLGLGYATSVGSHLGNSIIGDPTGTPVGSNDSFHVVDFNLTGSDPFSGNAVSSFTVYDVGAVPVVVFVNPQSPSGLGSLLVNNMPRTILSGFLDGTLGRVSDAVPQINISGTAGMTTFLREPLSGTYNTMEFAVPNNTELQSSQDVGLYTTSLLTNPNLALPSGSLGPNCSTTNPGVVGQNPLKEQVSRAGSSSSLRIRTIGTGNMIKNVIKTTDAMGYAFWGTGNFASATNLNAKYLTVDGVDPIQEVYDSGVLPVTTNGLLGNVTFSNVKNGSYPIWTKLRLVTTGSGIGANTLAAAAQNYVSPATPDFVPLNQLLVVRSHFAPPFNSSSVYDGSFPSTGGTNVPQNGSNICNGGSTPEAGGDVGGLVITLQADGDFCTDTGSSQGIVGRRQ